MGQIRHGSATTTRAVKVEMQRSQASISELSRELEINSKTVAKWRKRQTVEIAKLDHGKTRTFRSEGERESDAPLPPQAKVAEVRRRPGLCSQSLQFGTQSLKPKPLQVEPHRRLCRVAPSLFLMGLRVSAPTETTSPS